MPSVTALREGQSVRTVLVFISGTPFTQGRIKVVDTIVALTPDSNGRW